MKTRVYRTGVWKILFSVLTPLALAAYGSTSHAQSVASHVGSVDLAKIDAFVSAQMRASHIPGVSLGIVRGNQIIHLHGFGIANPSKQAVTPQIPFLLGSVTKSFTALAIMQLVQAGKVDLDAPVQRYLPWFRVADPKASALITVRDLLNQVSGIPTPAGIGPSDLHESLEAFVRSLRTVKLTAPVGSTFQYADANYTILGLIIRTVSGQDYGSYIQQHIFKPLHMQNSYTSAQQAKQHGLAQGYLWTRTQGSPVPFPEIDLSVAGFRPAGLLISTAQDMTHYLIAQMNQGRYNKTSVASPMSIATMHRGVASIPSAPPLIPPGSKYGMGWVNGPQAGAPAIWHNGETVTFSSYMIIEPQSNLAAIILINANRFSLTQSSPAIVTLELGVARLLHAQTSS